MANRLSSADDQDLIHKLRFLLFSKISEEWEIKWKKKHGSTFLGIEKLKSKNAFYEDLRIDICDELEKKHGRDILKEYLISKDSILRFLDEKYEYGFKENTLDIFAIYCGYLDWVDFKTNNPIESKPVPQNIVNVYTLITTSSQVERLREKQIIIETPARRNIYKWFLSGLIALSLISFSAYYYRYKYLPFREITADEIKSVKFEVSKQSHNYNPSVIFFDYDFSNLQLDSLKVDFDGNRGSAEQQFEILRNPKGKLRFDFYKPGVHNIALYHQKQLLKTIPVFLKSHGWALWYDRVEWTNTNFPYKDFYTNGSLFLHPEKIRNVAHRNNYFLKNVLAKDFGCTVDSLRLEYDIKHSPDDFAISCYGHAATFYTEKGNLFEINFARKGCVEESPKNSRLIYDGFKAQRLNFTKLFYEWARVKVEFKGFRVKLWINDELITESAYESDNGELKALLFLSKGSAMYDNVRLSNSYTNKTIMFDDFNTVPVSKDGY